MVVEDDDDLRELFVELLRQDGWHAHGVADSSAARAAIGTIAPDVFVLDFNLAGETTEGLLGELTSLPSPPAAVLVSAAEAARVVAARHGVPLISKPFDADELLVLVQAARARASIGRATRRWLIFPPSMLASA